MKNVFFEPYPYLYTFKKLPKILFIAFFLAFIFLYLFRPFSVHYSAHRYNFFLISLIQTSSACLIFFIYISFFNFFSTRANPSKHWNIFKETLLILFACFFIGIGAFFVREIIYISPNNLSWEHFYLEVSHSLLIGGVFFTLFTILNYYRLSILNKSKAQVSISDLNKENTEKLQTVDIETSVKSDSFNLDLSKFIFAKADGNYVEFYIEDSETFNKKLVRLSLKNLEKQLNPFTFIIRTHRTYLVNKNKIKNVSGNALGYELEFEHIDFQVPVSRGNIKNFNQLMN